MHLEDNVIIRHIENDIEKLREKSQTAETKVAILEVALERIEGKIDNLGHDMKEKATRKFNVWLAVVVALISSTVGPIIYHIIQSLLG